MSNTFKSIQFWNTQSGFKYPETDPTSPLCYQPILKRPNSGICVSGGGSVSASLIAGYYAALQELGIMNNLRYISGVSGGTWGSAPFVYKASNYQNFSGTVKLPGDIQENKTTKDLSTTVAGSMQDAVTKADIVDKALNYLTEAALTPKNRVYEKAVGSLFLRPFNILSPTNILKPAEKIQFFSSTSTVVNNINTRNDNKLSNGFMTMADNMPFLIMNATMFVPVKGGGNNIYPFEITPLYCGIKAPQASGASNQSIGGFFVESFGFNTKLTGANTTTNIATATGDYPFELCQPVGASGSALEGMLENKYPQLLGCFPQFNYWNPYHTDQGTQLYDFGDGGCIEDTGIAPLVARGVQNIASFLTEAVFFPDTVISNSTDYVGMPSFIERAFGYNQIACLFGLPTIDGEASLKTKDQVKNTPPYIVWLDAVPAKQIFDNSTGQFNTLMTALYNARNTGDPMVVSMAMNVLPCSLHGITPAAGYKPQVVWSVVDAASLWQSGLSQDAQDYMKANSDQFADFPVVAVFGQDLGSVIKLTAGQTNLLADFAYWMVKTKQDVFTSVLNPASVPAEAEAELA